METRANFVLVGAFTLLGILGTLALFLWLAKVQVDRQYAYYDVNFTDVSGLSEAGDVRFNGLPVGQVVRMGINPDHPGRIGVRIEIAADTPITADTVATLEWQGVTGVTYVALSGGKPESPRLTAKPGEPYPVIRSELSTFQSLFEGGPELIRKAITLLEELRAAVGPENQAAFAATLENLRQASGKLNTTLDDFSSLSANLSEAAKTVATFTDQLDPVAKGAVTALATADETLRTAQETIQKAQDTIGEATGALASARKTFDAADVMITDQLPGLISQVQSTAGSIETVVTDVGGRAAALTDKIATLADAATDRLVEAQATFARLDTAIEAATATMKSIDQTSQSVTTLVTGEGTQLVADARAAVTSARTAIDSANRIMVEDVPVIIENVKQATAKVNTVVDTVGQTITNVSGKVDLLADSAAEAIASATETFHAANTTLAAVTETVTMAQGTLGAAQQTFDGVNKMLEGDIPVIVGDVREAVGNLNEAIARIAQDVPQITGDVKQTLAKLRTLSDSLNSMVSDNSDQIRAFMQAGLPQFVRFVKEANLLVANLQRLTAKIESDPARFLLGTQATEFRR